MKLSSKYDKLMEFIYGKYSESDVMRSNGEPASVLVSQFQRLSGIRFGSAEAQRAAIRYLFEQGWIEVVSLTGNKSNGTLFFHSRIRPTRKGILYVEERRKCWLQKNWQNVYESTIAGIIKGLKR